MLVVEALLDDGYAVDQAANGAEALERLRDAVPDAILLDIMMPRVNGYDFVAHARANPDLAAVPIIVMTAAYAGRMIADQLGAQACLPKPFEVDELLSVVERAVAEKGATAARA